ncbi:PAS domain-containing sensor histidine kinase [Flavobacterium cerinum]|uniref:histidine kinase n=1 Tax=Flavobacterium cerinum TaxID=2502784 RepID=A0A444H8W3_9FLAO|nr:PAS domain-containing sensor histidine kinase [Flavobacterium cerinum]RWW99681.1 PAS domain-containing sensor histidine kinase [Flavobacterium cerinum]
MNSAQNATCKDSFNKDLIKDLPIAIYSCSPKGEITFYNPAATALWGREPQTDKDLWCGSWKIYNTQGALLQPEEYPTALSLNKDLSYINKEIIIERLDGSRVTVESRPAPITNNEGTITGIVNVLVDITEKRKNELLSQQLEKKVEDRYYSMVGEVHDYAILLLDREGHVLNWNKGAESIKGYTEKEIIGRNIRIFYPEEDRSNKVPESLIKTAIKHGRSMHEGWQVRKDGTKFWSSIVITPLRDDESGIIGFSKVSRDLTERKIAEDQLKNYALDIEFRNKQLEEYAYIASHDLQEPLRKIQIFGEMLENNLDNREAMLHYTEKINSSARRMTTLIKDVLKYSQLSRTEDLFEVTNLNVILQNVLEDFDLLIEQQNVTIVGTPLPTIKGIPIQLHQLFSNLISNAIKFRSPKPVIEIFTQKPSAEDIEMHQILNKGVPYTKIIFKDNGLGFEQQYGDQVFKMFKRLSNTSGTGIGLALCKKIVENHHGTITVTSEPGIGTAFCLFIPLV